MDKIYTDAEIREKASRALMFSWLYFGIAISILIYSVYLIFNSVADIYLSSMTICFLLFIPSAIYKDRFDKYTNQSSPKRITEILQDIEPYADLRDIFKKMYARGYLLKYEENLLLEEVNLKNAKEYEIRLSQDIRSTLNNW